MLEMPVKQPSRGAPAEMRSNKSSDTERAKDEGEEEEEKSGKRTKLSVCNVEISGGAFVQFFVCVAGVFGCGVTHDFVQELVFRYDGYDFGWFMTLWELLIFVVAAWVQLVQDKRYDEITTIKWREYVNLTIVLAITQGSGSAALSYVNFPVKVVFKSCKLIPTVSVNTVCTSVMR